MNKGLRRMLAGLVLVLVSCGLAWATGEAETGAAAGQPVTLTVELFDRNNTPKDQGTLEDNRWTRWIKEEMLKRGVEVKFFPIPRGEEEAKLNVLMGSGSAPDVVFTYNRFIFAKYAIDGGLNDLTAPLDRYGAEIKKVLGNTILDYGVLSGKQYAVPARRSSVAHRTAFIRKDWLAKLGIAAPTNRDELVQVLRSFKQRDPGGLGAERTIPWGYVNPDTGNGYEPHTFRPFNAMYSFLADDRKLGYTTPWPVREGFKDFAKYMNQLYRANLIDKEFATDTDALSLQKVMNGQVGFYEWSWWGPTQVSYGDVYRNLRKNVPGAELVAVEVFRNADGKYRKIAYPPVGLYIMSPKTSRNAEAMVKYLNWMAEKDVGWKITFGVEGEHYKLVEGAPLPIDNSYNQKTRDYLMGDLRLLFNGPYPIGEAIEDKLTVIENGDLGEFALASKKVAQHDSHPEWVFNEEIKSWSKYGPEIIKACNEFWVKMTVAEDFESVYAEFQKQLKARNIDEVVKEREAYYQKYYK